MNPTPEKTEATPFADDPPIELLNWICLGEEGEYQALATTALFERYRNWLCKALKKNLPQYDDVFLADFVIQTFSIVFKNAEKFKRITDEDLILQERRFKKWMLIIANNLYNTWNRKQADITTMDDDFWALAAERPFNEENIEVPAKPEVEAIMNVMSELSERERDILYAFLSHCPDITNRQSKLPRYVITELCERYDTNPENLRTIRSRTMKKVRAHLEMKGFTK